MLLHSLHLGMVSVVLLKSKPLTLFILMYYFDTLIHRQILLCIKKLLDSCIMYHFYWIVVLLS